MRGKSLIYQYVKVYSSILTVLILGFSTLASPLLAQLARPSLPDPIKFLSRQEMVMRASRAVLDQLGYKIELEDQKAGRIVTRPYEFISGALTSTEADKLAIKTDTVTGSWLRARYAVELLFEIISPNETMVTARTKMEALNRDADGTEKWVTLQSLGSVEKRVLGKISMKLLGTEPEFKDRKGFWEQKPTPVPIKKRPSA
jgi:hypothetical protein